MQSLIREVSKSLFPRRKLSKPVSRIFGNYGHRFTRLLRVHLFGFLPSFRKCTVDEQFRRKVLVFLDLRSERRPKGPRTLIGQK